MTPLRSPRKRLLLHALWVLVPFCALVGLSWSAWRSDAETRRQRLIEGARQTAERTLEDIQNALGPWTPLPTSSSLESPPLPDQDPLAANARDRYRSGDFEGVLGSPSSVRTESGVSLRSLAALQLIRRETDPQRLTELSTVLTGSLEFTSPPFLEETSRRFSELHLTSPPDLANWRNAWQRIRREQGFAVALRQRPTARPTLWIEDEGTQWLVERSLDSGSWRVTSEPDVIARAHQAASAAVRELPDGLAIELSVAGKPLIEAGSGFSLVNTGSNGWNASLQLVDAGRFFDRETRSRNLITVVIAIGALAVAIGLFLAGRAYLQAIDLARQQSEFMASVSHEMRTPLAAMRLLAENLESGVADRSGQRIDHVRRIREESSRLGDLVNNVLTFTREPDCCPHEPFEVAAMIDDAAALVRPMAAQKDVHFEFSVAEFPEDPEGDAPALRRALLNLLDNALKHTPSGGTIRGFAEPRGDHWHLTVSDSGPGIPPHERSQIFKAFYRVGEELRRTTPGTGLGLALVKRTIDAHHGRIEVDEPPGGGARFTVILPLHPPAP